MKDCDDCRYWDRTADDFPCCECMDYSEYEEEAAAPVKTWLDECAMMAMARYLVDRDDVNFLASGGTFDHSRQARECYDFADAMLAEKLRREKKASEHKHQQEEE